MDLINKTLVKISKTNTNMLVELIYPINEKNWILKLSEITKEINKAKNNYRFIDSYKIKSSFSESNEIKGKMYVEIQIKHRNFGIELR